MILAGDIGGTNTRLALFDRDLGVAPLWSETYPSRKYPGLEGIIREALDASGQRPRAASFGIAGPVSDGCCRATNLPWVVDARAIARLLGLGFCGLINDLEAHAYGLDLLEPGDLLTLQPGQPVADANEALVSAGTGLGQAGIYRDGRRRYPFASEGGHSDFAPTSSLQEELLVWLRERFGHVSWERVVSGPGLHNIYRFLRDTGQAPETSALAEALLAGDVSAAIFRAAQEGSSELAARSLSLFVQLYGAEAGNVALKFLATGGVYLGGGIAPKIARWLQDRSFLDAFLDKGRMRSLLEEIPVHVVLNDRTALLGASRHAHLDDAGESVRGVWPAAPSTRALPRPARKRP